MPPAALTEKRRLTPRRLGRRIAQVIYWAVVASVSLVGAVEITRQVFFQPMAPLPWASCREGLLALYTAVDQARLAAAGAEGEDAALVRFRSALLPTWAYRDGIAARCKGSAPDEGALDAIERLRYAEEHAVRREAGDLAPLRRSVRGIVDRDLTSQGFHP